MNTKQELHRTYKAQRRFTFRSLFQQRNIKIATGSLQCLKSTPKFILMQDKINKLVLISCVRSQPVRHVKAVSVQSKRLQLIIFQAMMAKIYHFSRTTSRIFSSKYIQNSPTLQNTPSVDCIRRIINRSRTCSPVSYLFWQKMQLLNHRFFLMTSRKLDSRSTIANRRVKENISGM